MTCRGSGEEGGDDGRHAEQAKAKVELDDDQGELRMTRLPAKPVAHLTPRYDGVADQGTKKPGAVGRRARIS